jgi:hypothetical protein
VERALHARLCADDPPAERVRDYLRSQCAGSVCTLTLGFIVNSQGVVTRVRFTPFANAPASCAFKQLLQDLRLPWRLSSDLILPVRIDLDRFESEGRCLAGRSSRPWRENRKGKDII